jgi:hypothetical protein
VGIETDYICSRELIGILVGMASDAR